jgi:hypothetical protein
LPRGFHAQAGTDTVNLGKEVSMGMLAERVDWVIGVDTHRDSHSAVVCTPTGAVTGQATVACGVRKFDPIRTAKSSRFAGETDFTQPRRT